MRSSSSRISFEFSQPDVRGLEGVPTSNIVDEDCLSSISDDFFDRFQFDCALGDFEDDRFF